MIEINTLPMREFYLSIQIILNYIRLNPEFFEEWHKSETAKLFASPVFRNQKKSAG